MDRQKLLSTKLTTMVDILIKTLSVEQTTESTALFGMILKSMLNKDVEDPVNFIRKWLHDNRAEAEGMTVRSMVTGFAEVPAPTGFAEVPAPSISSTRTAGPPLVTVVGGARVRASTIAFYCEIVIVALYILGLYGLYHFDRIPDLRQIIYGIGAIITDYILITYSPVGRLVRAPLAPQLLTAPFSAIDYFFGDKMHFYESGSNIIALYTDRFDKTIIYKNYYDEHSGDYKYNMNYRVICNINQWVDSAHVVEQLREADEAIRTARAARNKKALFVATMKKQRVVNSVLQGKPTFKDYYRAKGYNVDNLLLAQIDHRSYMYYPIYFKTYHDIQTISSDLIATNENIEDRYTGRLSDITGMYNSLIAIVNKINYYIADYYYYYTIPGYTQSRQQFLWLRFLALMTLSSSILQTDNFRKETADRIISVLTSSDIAAQLSTYINSSPAAKLISTNSIDGSELQDFVIQYSTKVKDIAISIIDVRLNTEKTAEEFTQIKKEVGDMLNTLEGALHDIQNIVIGNATIAGISAEELFRLPKTRLEKSIAEIRKYRNDLAAKESIRVFDYDKIDRRLDYYDKYSDDMDFSAFCLKSLFQFTSSLTAFQANGPHADMDPLKTKLDADIQHIIRVVNNKIVPGMRVEEPSLNGVSKYIDDVPIFNNGFQLALRLPGEPRIAQLKGLAINLYNQITAMPTDGLTEAQRTELEAVIVALQEEATKQQLEVKARINPTPEGKACFDRLISKKPVEEPDDLKNTDVYDYLSSEDIPDGTEYLFYTIPPSEPGAKEKHCMVITWDAFQKPTLDQAYYHVANGTIYNTGQTELVTVDGRIKVFSHGNIKVMADQLNRTTHTAPKNHVVQVAEKIRTKRRKADQLLIQEAAAAAAASAGAGARGAAPGTGRRRSSFSASASAKKKGGRRKTRRRR